MRRLRACSLLLAGLATTSPATAQYGVIPDVIGGVVGGMVAEGAEADCMRGTAKSAAEVAEAREPAVAIMAQYFAAAQTGAARSAAFHLDGKTSFTVAGKPVGMADVDAGSDPLAKAGNVLADRPLRFFRSGLDATALGQWAVRRPDGTTAGIYTALFARKAKVWKLRELTVAVPGEKVAPAMQFCHAPGDVEPFRLRTAVAMRERAEKRVAKAQERFAGSTRDATETARLRSDLSRRESELGEARSMERQAEEAMRTVERLTVDAAESRVLASTG